MKLGSATMSAPGAAAATAALPERRAAEAERLAFPEVGQPFIPRNILRGDLLRGKDPELLAKLLWHANDKIRLIGRECDPVPERLGKRRMA